MDQSEILLHFHSWTLDSETHVDFLGCEQPVDCMDQDYAENVLAWLLDNAQEFHRLYRIREQGIVPAELDNIAWKRLTFEPRDQACRWMLRTLLARALMAHLVECP